MEIRLAIGIAIEKGTGRCRRRRMGKRGRRSSSRRRRRKGFRNRVGIDREE